MRGGGRAASEGQDADRRAALTVWLIFAVAWALRLVYVLHLRASPLADFPVLDELYHVEWARALAAGPGAILICGRFEGLDERVRAHLRHGVAQPADGLGGQRPRRPTRGDPAIRLGP